MRRGAAACLLFMFLASALMVSGDGGVDGAGSGALGRATSRETTLIHNVFELQNMSKDLKGSYELACDIDASVTVNWNGGAGFAPVGNRTIPFNGTLDGKGYNISGLFINRPGTDCIGLFGYAGQNNSLKSIGVRNINVSGRDHVGGLVGYNLHGAVNNSYATGCVTGTSNVGGLVGNIEWDVPVINSGASGNVTGAYSVGGLVGAATFGGTIINSYAVGNVNGSNDVGGLVGRLFYSMLENSYAAVNVTGINHSGGLVGSINPGGVTTSYAIGNVKGVNFVGGLVGDNNGEVNNSYAMGDVNGTSSVGGLVGSSSSNPGTVDNSFATGYVTGTDSVGGLAGNNSGGASKCFWDIETSGQSSSSGGTGKTTVEMKTLCTFTGVGWDFNDVWFMVENVTYPVFQWQDITFPVADAGIDQTINEGTVVTFDGRGSSDLFGIANYTWSFRDGNPRTIYGVGPIYKFINPGIFNVELKVTNIFGYWNNDTMTVTVNDITPPVSNAGPDQIVDEGTLVTFSGSGSSDNVGIMNFTWTFSDGAPVTLYGAQPTYQFDNPGIFAVTLNVTDAAGNRNTGTVNITVNDITAPVADAGPDRTIDEGTILTFNGTGSLDEVGVVYYSWTFMDRSTITLFGHQPEYQFDHSGIFVVMLNVTDAAGNWGTDTMTVRVIDVTKPVANAGPDRIFDEVTLMTFNGTGSYDNAEVVNYSWTFMDVALVTLYGAQPAYRFDNPGIFIVTLNVTDAAGNWGADKVTVTVNDTTEPVADAGPDQTVDEGTLVTFNGSGSSDNVLIVNYTWIFDCGTQRIVLHGVSPSSAFSVPGVYHMTFVVSDAAGFWREDNMTLTVRDITPPVAAAGPDRKVPAGSSIFLNGSRSTDNVAISKFLWNFTYGGKPQSLDGENVSFEFDAPGVYEVVLTVVDRAGNRGQDLVSVTVEPTVKVDNGGLTGFNWMPALLIAVMIMAVGAGYYVFRERKRARPKNPWRSEIPPRPAPSREMEEE